MNSNLPDRPKAVREFFAKHEDSETGLPPLQELMCMEEVEGGQGRGGMGMGGGGQRENHMIHEFKQNASGVGDEFKGN